MSRAEAQRTQRRLFRQDEQDEQDEEWIEKRESLLFILSILFILSKFLSCSALSAPLRDKIFAKLRDSDGLQRSAANRNRIRNCPQIDAA
jgi:hypothetical protein